MGSLIFTHIGVVFIDVTFIFIDRTNEGNGSNRDAIGKCISYAVIWFVMRGRNVRPLQGLMCVGAGLLL